MHFSLLPVAAFIGLVAGCARHDNHQRQYGRLQRVARAAPGKDWTYEASFNWGSVNPDYELCQTGTQQSPVGLRHSDGFSSQHTLDFSASGGNVTGNFFNWGYGPAFTLHREDEDDYTSLPAITFDDETVYLGDWHIHAPAEHAVDGTRSRAEMHFVLYTGEGQARAVLAFRIDPGPHDSSFFGQLPSMIKSNDTDTEVETTLDVSKALEEASYFDEFWTYTGSLTTPPCTEEIRFFIPSAVLSVSVDQMRAILGACTYSARVEQTIWQHDINV